MIAAPTVNVFWRIRSDTIIPMVHGIVDDLEKVRVVAGKG